MPVALPIDAFLDVITTAVAERGALVLRAETGAGKTTRVPAAMLDRRAHGQVVLVQPRRVAARAAAERIAAERGSRLGDEVGFRVRFERRESRGTRLICLTDGMLLAWLQADPFLEGVVAVVFDEAHERTLAGDLALAMVARVRREVRPELAIVVMSATLEAEPFAGFLEAAVLDVPGRSFPVEIQLLARPDQRPLPVRIASKVQEALEVDDGDVLVFLPGRGEIGAVARELQLRDIDVFELHGDLPLEQQIVAIRRGRRRRVVLATNVAESSLTVEGITSVVDSTLVRIATHDPARDLPRLDLVGASRAALDQRSGRAGRERPGRCWRLLTASELAARPPAEVPAVRRLDPASSVLELLAWGEAEPDQFPWLEPPPVAALARAWGTLAALGAVDGSRRLTDRGRVLARLPLAPRLGCLAVECWLAGYGEEAARAAVVLEQRDLAPEGFHSGSRNDLLDRLELLGRERRRGGRGGQIERAAREVERVLEGTLGPAPALPELDLEEALGRALLTAWPDRLARRRGPRSYQLASGRGARLLPTSALGDPELVLALDLVDRGTEASIRLAATIEAAWLDPTQIAEDLVVGIEAASGRVVGQRVRRYAGLVLDQRDVPVDAETAAAVLVAAVIENPEQALQWREDPVLAGLDARLQAIAAVHPTLEVPDLAALLRVAAPAVARGCRSLEEVRRAPWLAVVSGLLPRETIRALERDAPEHWTLATGRKIKILWELGQPPVLAVRIQDLFGQPETPRLGGGEIPLLLHLLAPNGRPQQVTQDLASFWRETYQQVRRELRGRYPKHPWPEDPLNAVPPTRPGRG